VPDLPRNALGKVQKNILREQFRDAFASVPDIRPPMHQTIGD